MFNLYKIFFSDMENHIETFADMDEFMRCLSIIDAAVADKFEQMGYVSSSVCMCFRPYEYSYVSSPAIRAVRSGHIDCLRLSLRLGCHWGSHVAMDAVSYDQLECLKFLIENGCYIDIFVLKHAIAYDRLECLLILRRFETSEFAYDDMYEYALMHNSMSILEYLHENGKLHFDRIQILASVTNCNNYYNIRRARAIEFMLSHHTWSVKTLSSIIDHPEFDTRYTYIFCRHFYLKILFKKWLRKTYMPGSKKNKEILLKYCNFT